jgi:hypothetical protein
VWVGWVMLEGGGRYDGAVIERRGATRRATVSTEARPMSRATTTNHFISVSRRGELMARRKGQPPVCITTAQEGLVITPDDLARASGVPSPLRIHFEHGGGNRTLCVTSIVTPDGTMHDVDAFLERHVVAEPTFAQWIRRTIEDALDRAEREARPDGT